MPLFAARVQEVLTSAHDGEHMIPGTVHGKSMDHSPTRKPVAMRPRFEQRLSNLSSSKIKLSCASSEIRGELSTRMEKLESK